MRGSGGVSPGLTTGTQSDLILNVVRKEAQVKSGIRGLDVEKNLNKDKLVNDLIERHQESNDQVVE